MTKAKNKVRRQFKGLVISDKMNKTVVVKVERFKIHPKYKKRFILRKQYKVHDEKNEYHQGDRVLFEECRPISKEKRWRIIKKLSTTN